MSDRNVITIGIAHNSGILNMMSALNFSGVTTSGTLNLINGDSKKQETNATFDK
jgi:hypothetical protein